MVFTHVIGNTFHGITFTENDNSFHLQNKTPLISIMIHVNQFHTLTIAL